MAKLVCDFDSFDSIMGDIVNKINEYKTVLSDLIELENIDSSIWYSKTQQAFYSKFMERKADLEELLKDYVALMLLLKNISSTYKNIENSF